MRCIAAMLLTAVLGGSCTQATKPTRRREARAKFHCQNRMASFVRTSGRVQDSVVISCAGSRPFIRRWVTDLDTANRREASHSLSFAQFSSLWMSVGATGWYRSRWCDSAGKTAVPITTVFRVSQGAAGIRRLCLGKKWPRQLTRLHKVLIGAGRRYAPWVGAPMPR